MSKRLPKTIYVQWNEDSDDDPFLDVRDLPEKFAELDDSLIVGEYEFVRKVKVTNNTTID